MRYIAAPLLLLLGLVARAPAQTPAACTGLCLQQVSCPAGQTTSVTGTIYMPNGTDPLPRALVYIPNAPVPALPAGVSCPLPGQPPPGSPLVGTSTGIDGSFTITGAPVGANIPLVVQSGKWRRQVTIPATTACTATTFSTRLPQNQTEGDIPKFAIATGSADQVECVLLKAGIASSEFTNPSGTGRINLYSGSNSAGALIDGATPSQSTLMSSAANLANYDVLMLPCQGGQFIQPATQLANFINYANAGGRVYSSHYSYVWMYNNPPFNAVVNWHVSQPALANGAATVNVGFPQGLDLSQWLQEVGASITPGQIAVSTVKHDLDGVLPPTQSWLTLNDTANGNPVMQFVFDTPISSSATQCGRILFNDYHVEAPAKSPKGVAFPNECAATPLTAQEKLLEYSLFELTDEGGQPELSPTSQDFGSVPLGFASAPHTFTWTNNSTFTVSAIPTTTGDFAVASSTCASVLAGASCQLAVTFTPTALGPRSGTLAVASNGSTLEAALTGIGIPDLSISSTTLSFGNVDVGNHVAQTLTLTNNAPGNLTLPTLTTTGPFTASTNCPASLPALASCTVTVTFTPPTTGPQTGTLTAGLALNTTVQLTGNGVDFAIVANPTLGSLIAGFTLSTTVTTSPIAGFAAPVALSCATNAVASACTPATLSFIPAPTTTAVSIATTSKYTVIGYGSLAAPGLLGLGSFAASLLLFRKRKHRNLLARVTLLTLLCAAASLGLSACAGSGPARNPQYTSPGTYTYTISATDGFLTRTATYTLTVTAQ